ncbi:carbamoyltransferase HypF, partial [bacterium]|nr:carbamoyltransferase HypF [bacterium]
MSGQTRVRIDVNGRVQGVGFRPTVYRYALERGLVGWVSNTSHGVIIELEGISESVDDFIETLKSAPPPQAKITDITTRNLPLKQDKKFEIRPSVVAANAKTQISADISTCSDCLSELKDSKDRRYGYPFLNCTNCGPRFTIIKDIPYDRCKTTMDEFKMCPKCQAEYDDPSNRRFHAQPNACYQCGPQLTLIKSTTLTPSTMERPTSHVLRPSALASTLEVLRRGKIVAIKGLGGYHLACDALNDEAVRNLRSRKFREDKCFALMAADIDTIKKYCHVSKEEEELLLSYKRPIVLLRRKIPNPKSKIPKIVEDVAPNNKYLGFMLPYTPLHHLLFTNNERRTTNDEPRVLVMTSGNTSDEPIAYKDQDASKRLCHIADYYLTHNREVHMRTDDSVSRIFSTTGKESIVRRSRGYAPSPIRVPFKFNHQVLACGAHLKNTFALARDNEVFVSHHIGDLGNFETINAFGSGVKHFEKLLNIKPEVVACDLHHAYYSTK